MTTIFINNWFVNSKWWFTSSLYDDDYISNTYQYLLNIDISNEPFLNQIIIYDQLPRHIFRNTYSNHIILYYLQKALEIFKKIDINNIDNFNIHEWCFIMLPYRHTNNIKLILYVMKLMWEKLDKINDNNDKLILKKFIKATYQNSPMGRGESYLDQKCLINYYNNNQNYKNIDIIKDNFSLILDKTNKYIHVNIDIDLKKRTEKFKKHELVILSISGGVDSMICSTLFKPFKAAIHINYCNRETSNNEEEFVKAWCNYMQIPLYIRRITEIQRNSCMNNDMRQVYESYTRNVRYCTYKYVHSMIIDSNSEYKNIIPSIILGHNKDDCLENIFTNISNQNHYDNLNGMTEISIQDGIQFLRPLLNISKDEIRAFANINNIPHLPNSTPEWSTRGQIRNKIIPALNNWNKCFVKNMFPLSDIISNLYIYFEKYIEQLFQEFKNNNKIIIQIEDLSLDKLFWKILILKITESIISEKSLENLINQIIIFKEKKTKIFIVIKKNINIEIKKINNLQVEISLS